MPDSTTLAFATDIHRDRRVFGWLDEAARSFDVVAIGGDLDYPCQGLKDLKLNVLLHALMPTSVRDRILAVSERTGKVPTVLGNHDRPDARALHGTRVTVAGLAVGGVGGSLPEGRFPFEVREEQYEALLAEMGPVDVLIAHQPPLGTRCDVSYGGEHRGSRAIREYVDRQRPRLVLSGHVHESPAVDVIGGTTFLNPGPFFLGSYGVVELDENSTRATIKRFQP